MINLFFVCKVTGIYKQGQYLKEMKKNREFNNKKVLKITGLYLYRHL